MKKLSILVCLLMALVLLFCACDAQSAYDIAVKNGFQGTEAEWLESLKGDKGDNGDSNVDPENPQGLDFYLLPDGTYAVSAGKAVFAKEITVPATYRGKAVTCVGMPGYLDDDNLYGLGFYGLPLLEKINLPDSITTIGCMAFGECPRLTSFTLPKNVKHISSDAFYNCNNLFEIYNLSALEIVAGSSDHGGIAENALAVHNDANAPSEIFTTGDGYVFYTNDDANILLFYAGTDTELVLPADCKGEDYKIHNSAFEDTGVTSIHVSAGVTEIGSNAFFGCSALETVTFAENSQLQAINDYTFRDCALKSITIPAGITEIGNCAFYRCDDLKTVFFAENSQLSTIGQEAFYNCKALMSITIPTNVKTIGSRAFYNCSSLFDVLNLSALQITAGSTDHGYVAYYAVEIRNTASASEALFVTENGYIFLKGVTGNYLIGYTGTETDLVLPADCKGEDYEIYEGAFTTIHSMEDRFTQKRPNFTSVFIPAGVTAIGDGAFLCCEALTNITFAENSRLTKIGDSAFEECSALTGITLPASIETIGAGAFNQCYLKMGSFTIPAKVTEIGEWAFRDCKFYEIYNHSKLEIRGGDSNSHGGIAGNALVVHTEGNAPSRVFVTNDGYVFYTYEGSHSLCGYIGVATELVLPDDYKGEDYSINRDAFEYTNITSVHISAGVTEIGSEAFFGCSALETVTFETVSGWSIKSSLTNPVAISSDDLANTTTAAEYLSDTYTVYIWTRE